MRLYCLIKAKDGLICVTRQETKNPVQLQFENTTYISRIWIIKKKDKSGWIYVAVVKNELKPR